MGSGKFVCESYFFIHLIDFGFSKSWINLKNGTHIERKKVPETPGNPTFASISAHEGMERSRKDDIESIAYILIYFATQGYLPWIGIDNNEWTK